MGGLQLAALFKAINEIIDNLTWDLVYGMMQNSAQHVMDDGYDSVLYQEFESNNAREFIIRSYFAGYSTGYCFWLGLTFWTGTQFFTAFKAIMTSFKTGQVIAGTPKKVTKKAFELVRATGVGKAKYALIPVAKGLDVASKLAKKKFPRFTSVVENSLEVLTRTGGKVTSYSRLFQLAWKAKFRGPQEKFLYSHTRQIIAIENKLGRKLTNLEADGLFKLGNSKMDYSLPDPSYNDVAMKNLVDDLASKSEAEKLASELNEISRKIDLDKIATYPVLRTLPTDVLKKLDGWGDDALKEF